MQGPFQGGVPGIVRGRRVSWSTAGLLAMLFLLFVGVACLILSFTTRSNAALSSFVQAHGVRSEAVIVNVDNIADKSSKTTTYTAKVLVSLTVPVDGQARTTVHVPSYEFGRPGGALTVLVDPDDPGYAQLPGSPTTAAGAPTILLILGISLTVVAIAGSALIARSRSRSTAG